MTETQQEARAWEVQFRRPDGTFVILLRGQPYHVVPADPLFAEVALAGADAPFEPQPDFPLPPADPKLAGIEFDGVMCSATKDDQTGLMAVLLAIQLQGAAFPPTRFEFENGNTLVITLANYQAFMAVWLPFRQSFFLAAGS